MLSVLHPPSSSAPPSNPHSARCTASAKLPATSCLGAFWTPVAAARGRGVIPASKNLHIRRHRGLRQYYHPGPELLLLGGRVDIVLAHEFEFPVAADAEHADGSGEHGDVG